MRVTTDALTRFSAVAVPAFLFYLALSGTLNTFEIVTGTMSAVAVAVFFTDTTFETSPTVRETPARLLRAVLFVPYLLWEIVKANITMAYLILHPSLPIEPQFKEYETPERGTLELSALATSITLTPGTLVSDVHDDGFEIHVLTSAAWDSLLAGALERAVGFIFAGRAISDEPTPEERMTQHPPSGKSSTDD